MSKIIDDYVSIIRYNRYGRLIKGAIADSIEYFDLEVVNALNNYQGAQAAANEALNLAGPAANAANAAATAANAAAKAANVAVSGIDGKLTGKANTSLNNLSNAATARANLGIPNFDKTRGAAANTLVQRDYAGSIATNWINYQQKMEALRLQGQEFRDGYGSLFSNCIILGMDATGPYMINESVYNRTYSSAANMHITSNGVIARSVSAKKYKTDIKNLDINEDIIMGLKPRSWIDKAQKERTKKALKDDNIDVDYEMSPKDYYKQMGWDVSTLPRHIGLIAEEVESLDGGEVFVEYGEDGQVEGLMYDRLILAAAVKIQSQQKQIDDLEKRLSALEAK